MELMRISKDTSRLHAAFGSNLYASRYSFISEICQNAVDSHRMAGVTEPVVVGIKTILGRDVFFVKDVGLSFTDEQDFIGKVATIAESGKSREKTKDENCAMGEHGVGSMSPSAFSKKWRFEVVCTTGKKFQCVFEEFPGEGIKFGITKMRAKEDDVKGVLFEIDVPPMGVVELVKNIKAKLAYFKDILFQFPDHYYRSFPELLTINTDFEIFQSEDFQVSTLSIMKDMHVCLDQYSYPINWQYIGYKPIPLNIGLRFTLGDGLKSDITRENLQYSDNYISLIKEKIEKVADWFVNRYNSSVAKPFDSIGETRDKLSEGKVVTINSYSYRAEHLVPYSKIKFDSPRFKDVPDNLVSAFIRNTACGNYLIKQTHSISKNGNKISKYSSTAWESNRIFVDQPIPTRTMDYIKVKYIGYGLYYKRDLKMFGSDSYYNTGFGLTSIYGVYKNNYREFLKKGIKEYDMRSIIKHHNKMFESSIQDSCVIASEIVVPPDFNKTPRAKAVRKADDQVGIKYAESMTKNDYTFACKFVEKIVISNNLYKQPYLHIYGVETDRPKLDTIYRMYEGGTRKKVRVCIVGSKQHKHLKGLKNFMEIDEFMKGKHRVFREMVTSILITDELIKPYKETWDNCHLIEQYISKEIAKDIDTLDKYVRKYPSSTHIDDKIRKSIVELGHDLKLYDLSVWEKMQSLKKVLDNLDYINYLDASIGVRDTERSKKAVKALQDITRQRKIKMDWQHYKLRTDESGTESE